MVALLVIGLLLSYRSGVRAGTEFSDRANAETQRLRIAVQTSQQTIELQAVKLGHLRAESRLNHQSERLIQTEMIELKHQLAQLQTENSIFRKVMDPESFEKGLSIRSWEIQPSVQLHHFKFELVIQQLASRHPLLNGHVQVEISGFEEGTPRVFNLEQVSDEITKSKIKLRFRYFQEIRGEIILPESFLPETIRVTAYSRGKRPQRREKNFEWIPVKL